MNYDELRKQIEKGCRKHFTLFQEELSASEICGYALYSDSDAMSVSLAINTKEELAELVDDEPEDEISYKWNPQEWAYDSEGGEDFDRISNTLTKESSSHINTATEEEHFSYADSVFNCCVEALQNLVKEGFFNNSPDAVIVFSVFDYEDKEKSVAWVEGLNSKELVAEYRDLLIS